MIREVLHVNEKVQFFDSPHVHVAANFQDLLVCGVAARYSRSFTEHRGAKSLKMDLIRSEIDLFCWFARWASSSSSSRVNRTVTYLQRRWALAPNRRFGVVFSRFMRVFLTIAFDCVFERKEDSFQGFRLEVGE